MSSVKDIDWYCGNRYTDSNFVNPTSRLERLERRLTLVKKR